VPKLKTHKGAQKRFHITGRGKILRVKQGKSHLRRKKARRAKRLYDDMIALHPSTQAKVSRLIPYGL
jgi:large subunit ribosomal protein L35